jgi:hypothetical protein
LALHSGQIVEIRFFDGARVRAHITNIDPKVLENHVFCEVLQILDQGPPSASRIHAGERFWCAARHILEITETDGRVYLEPPAAERPRPWWKFW